MNVYAVINCFNNHTLSDTSINCINCNYNVMHNLALAYSEMFTTVI